MFLRGKLTVLDHSRVVSSFRRFQAKYADADPLFLRAIEIGEKTLGPDDPQLATLLNNRAGVLKDQVTAVKSFQDVSWGASPLFKNPAFNDHAVVDHFWLLRTICLDHIPSFACHPFAGQV